MCIICQSEHFKTAGALLIYLVFALHDCNFKCLTQEDQIQTERLTLTA